MEKEWYQVEYCERDWSQVSNWAVVYEEDSPFFDNLRWQNKTGLSDIYEVAYLLGKRERMPLRKEEPELYYKIKYFFKKYKDDEDVKKIMRMYPTKGICSLYEKGEHESAYYHIAASFRGRGQVIKKMKIAMEYVLETYRLYNVLPASRTVPMKMIQDLLEYPQRYLPSEKFDVFVITEEEYSQFVTELIDLGCMDYRVENAYSKLK